MVIATQTRTEPWTTRYLWFLTHVTQQRKDFFFFRVLIRHVFMHRSIFCPRKRFLMKSWNFYLRNSSLSCTKAHYDECFCHEIEASSFVVCSYFHAQLELRVVQDLAFFSRKKNISIWNHKKRVSRVEWNLSKNKFDRSLKGRISKSLLMSTLLSLTGKLLTCRRTKVCAMKENVIRVNEFNSVLLISSQCLFDRKIGKLLNRKWSRMASIAKATQLNLRDKRSGQPDTK